MKGGEESKGWREEGGSKKEFGKWMARKERAEGERMGGEGRRWREIDLGRGM